MIAYTHAQLLVEQYTFNALDKPNGRGDWHIGPPENATILIHRLVDNSKVSQK